MNLQEKMFLEVENWMASGMLKVAFLKGKPYSEAKFNYWMAKWKAKQLHAEQPDFREMVLSDVKLSKVLEIIAPSGVKITVFA